MVNLLLPPSAPGGKLWLVSPGAAGLKDVGRLRYSPVKVQSGIIRPVEILASGRE